MTESLIEVHGLRKTFGNVVALDNVGFSIARGEAFTLLGPSGCGKTTTLRMHRRAGDARERRIQHRRQPVFDAARRINVPPEKRDIGMVFQSYAIWPHMTVAENVAYPLEAAPRAARRESRERVAARARAGRSRGARPTAPRPSCRAASSSASRWRGRWSTSPRCCCSTSRSATSTPSCASRCASSSRRCRSASTLTLIYVTHDQSEALSLSDRIALMSQGHVEQIGTPDALYEHPATEFVRDFLGKTVTLPGRVAAVEGRAARVALTTASGTVIWAAANGSAMPHEGAEVVVAIRPERIAFASEGNSDGNRLTGRVETVLYQGERAECMVRVGDELITIYGPPAARGLKGREVTLAMAPEAISLWPK